VICGVRVATARVWVCACTASTLAATQQQRHRGLLAAGVPAVLPGAVRAAAGSWRGTTRLQGRPSVHTCVLSCSALVGVGRCASSAVFAAAQLALPRPVCHLRCLQRGQRSVTGVVQRSVYRSLCVRVESARSWVLCALSRLLLCWIAARWLNHGAVRLLHASTRTRTRSFAGQRPALPQLQHARVDDIHTTGRLTHCAQCHAAGHHTPPPPPLNPRTATLQAHAT
jgi:hypothetical protein